MAKQWELDRTEIKPEPVFGKYHNPTKMRELDEQLEQVCAKAQNHDLVQKLCRKLIEEVANIIQHNKSWNTLRVRSEFKWNPNTFKFQLVYDGGHYFDPKDLPNIMGLSLAKFDSYNREPEVDPTTGEVRINISITLKVNENE